MGKDQRLFNSVAIIVFLIVTVVHGARMFYGWDVWFEDVFIPQWVSGIVVVLGAFMITLGSKLSKKK